MRLRGVRLSRDELARAAVVRGNLRVQVRGDMHRNRGVPVAMLQANPNVTAFALPVLDHVRLARLEGNSFVLSGIEEVFRPRKGSDHYAQSWWCRLVQAQPAALLRAEDDGHPPRATHQGDEAFASRRNNHTNEQRRKQ